MFKYDFIILYEHRNRELENAVLLAMMLEKRGYKVAIEYRRSARILFQRAEVILTPFFYNNDNVIDFTLQPFNSYKKVINMQYEQVFLKKNEEMLGDLPDELAKNAVHISWGKNTTDRFQKVGIASNNIFEIGHISMDLNMPKYRKAFFNRHSISKRFNIPEGKKWLLFISSFSCVGLTKTEFEKWKAQTVTVDYFSEISNKTQPLILDMFEKLVKERPDLVVVYRPHPHEDACDRLKKLAKKYDNFIINSNYSIRQWLLVCNYISTWCSTSLVDVMYAKKPCAIIRPIDFPEEYDYNIFRDQKQITNYKELLRCVDDQIDSYLVNEHTIKDYYCNDYDANTFEKMCEVCIKIKNNSKYSYDYSNNISVSPLYLMKIYIYKIMLSCAGLIDFHRIIPEKYRADFQYAYREMNNYKKEIEFYKKKFSRIIKNEKK